MSASAFRCPRSGLESQNGMPPRFPACPTISRFPTFFGFGFSFRFPDRVHALGCVSGYRSYVRNHPLHAVCFGFFFFYAIVYCECGRLSMSLGTMTFCACNQQETRFELLSLCPFSPLHVGDPSMHRPVLVTAAPVARVSPANFRVVVKHHVRKNAWFLVFSDATVVVRFTQPGPQCRYEYRHVCVVCVVLMSAARLSCSCAWSRSLLLSLQVELQMQMITQSVVDEGGHGKSNGTPNAVVLCARPQMWCVPRRYAIPVRNVVDYATVGLVSRGDCGARCVGSRRYVLNLTRRARDFQHGDGAV